MTLITPYCLYYTSVCYRYLCGHKKVGGVSRLVQWLSFHCVLCNLLIVGISTPYWAPLSTTGDELNKRMDMMVDLRKATNHPLLLRHYYTDHTLHCMVHEDHPKGAQSQRCCSQPRVGGHECNVRLWAAQPLHTVQGVCVWACVCGRVM